MFSLRKKTVEKRNSRGDIVRKEEVVTLTKRIHASTKTQPKKLQTPPTDWNPKFPLPLQNSKVPLPLPPSKFPFMLLFSFHHIFQSIFIH